MCNMTQIILDIYTLVALDLFNKFVELLMSYT